VIRRIAEAPDRCTLCRALFVPGATVYAGFADNDAAEVVSDCCVGRLTQINGIDRIQPETQLRSAEPPVKTATMGPRTGISILAGIFRHLRAPAA
jgi:hypothetical protein